MINKTLWSHQHAGGVSHSFSRRWFRVLLYMQSGFTYNLNTQQHSPPLSLSSYLSHCLPIYLSLSVCLSLRKRCCLVPLTGIPCWSHSLVPVRWVHLILSLFYLLFLLFICVSHSLHVSLLLICHVQFMYTYQYNNSCSHQLSFTAQQESSRCDLVFYAPQMIHSSRFKSACRHRINNAV